MEHLEILNFTQEEINDGVLLFSFREQGLSEDEAKTLLEALSNKVYLGEQWEKIQYMADMECIRITELYPCD